jgi:hypothetical protein
VYGASYNAKVLDGYDESATPIIFKLRITSFMKVKDNAELELICSNNLDEVIPLLTKDEEEESFKWAANNQGKCIDDTAQFDDDIPFDSQKSGGASGKKSSASHKEARPESKRSSKPEESGGSNNFLLDGRTFTGFQGKHISSNTFRSACERGCAYCGDPIDFNTEAIDQEVIFINDDDLVCGGCQSTKEFQEEFLEFGPEIDKEVLAAAFNKTLH